MTVGASVVVELTVGEAIKGVIVFMVLGPLTVGTAPAVGKATVVEDGEGLVG
jgi:hypothetical protein